MAKSRTSKKPNASYASKWKSRNRYHLVLKDQGPSQSVSLHDLGVTGRDLSWGPHADNFMRANQACFDALDLDVHLTRRPNQVDLSIQAKGTIGACPLRAPDTHHIAGGVIVCPRFGWNSIGSLLSAIGWSAAPELMNFPQVPGSAREIPSWVIAGPAVNHLEQLLQYSNPRFRYVEELRSSPRGQINWDDYCSRRITSGNPHLMSCRFPDLAADERLRSHIRWALEKISADLYQFTDRDTFALKLLSRVKALIASIYSVKPLPPSHQELLALQRQMQQSPNVALGFEAIRWILDERGLAGNMDLDGLSWRIKMHELFEQWVEALVRTWAKEFGASVSVGRKFESQVPIAWERSAGAQSLSSLIPDLIVRTDRETFIFDAKYKGFLDEIDERRWIEMAEYAAQEHRHDLHQVLAYSSMYSSGDLTAALVYPMTFEAWAQLSQQGLALRRGIIEGMDRTVRVALLGVPIELKNGIDLSAVTEAWNALRRMD